MKNLARTLVCLAIAANVSAQSAQSAVEAELRRLNDEVSEMQVKKDVATADRLLADEYVFVQPDGVISHKAGALAVLKSPDYDVTTLTTEDVQVRVYGDAAVVTGIARFEATYGGQDVGSVFRYTDVWVRRDGRWQTVSSHASPLPQMEVQRLTSALVGTWTLRSWEARTTNGGLSWPMGKDAIGVLVYNDTGNVVMQIMDTKSQAAVAYFGTYTVDDKAGTVTHHVDVSSVKSEVGTDPVWTLAMYGQNLRISMSTKTPDGKTVTSVLAWERLP